MRLLGWCHNGYHNLPPNEVIRRARLAQVDAVIVKYGDPTFERALTAAGMAWGVERFAYAAQAADEGRMLADAVGAGAAFAVANCEPNDGGGWGEPGAATAIGLLIDTFRRRHPQVALYICADLRRGRSLDAPFVREAADRGLDGWMAMVYAKAFGQPVATAFDAAFPGAKYLGLPCAPVLQAYDGVGPAMIRAQIHEARTRGAASCSLYLLETATDDELRAASQAIGVVPAVDSGVLRDTALAYLRGAVAILDHGTPAELAAWGRLFSGGGA